MSEVQGQAPTEIRRTVELLVRGELLTLISENLLHPELLQITQTGRGGLPIIEKTIERYPGIMTMPPEEQFGHVSFYEIQDSSSSAHVTQIVFDLWFDEQASDLSAIFETVPSRPDHGFRLSDVHVL